MSNTKTKLLLLIAYCIPYSFLAVNGDASSGTMLFYGVMLAAFAALCVLSIKTRNIWITFIGGILSGVSSYLTTSLSALAPMGHYFKPFTSHSLIIAVSVVVFIVQSVIVLVYLSRRHKEVS